MKWWIPYGKIVCAKCAKNKPGHDTDIGALKYYICPLCGVHKQQSHIIGFMIADKPERHYPR